MKRNQRGGAAVVVLSCILGLILIVGIAIGGYQLNWWLKGQEVNRNSKIQRTSYEVQQTYREQVLKDIQTISEDDLQIASPLYKASVAQIRAARIHDVAVACDHISRLTTSGAGVDPDIQLFHDQECA